MDLEDPQTTGAAEVDGLPVLSDAGMGVTATLTSV